MTSRRAFLQTSLASLAATQLPAAPSTSQNGKKGLGMTLKNPAHLPTLKDLQLHWLYTWGGKRPPDVPEAIEFVPMIWGYWGKPASIRQTSQRAKAAGIDTLLGFNEPDGKHQANLSVEKALKAWPHLVETGLRLGSPACVHPDNEWMKTFMAATKRQKLPVDFVCVHSYGGANPKTFLERMEKIHRLYGKPLWITELAVGDWQAKTPEQNRYRPDKVLKFMEAVLPAMEKRDYIEKYAWFPAGQKSTPLGTSALFNAKGQLTRLGEYYRDYR